MQQVFEWGGGGGGGGVPERQTSKDESTSGVPRKILILTPLKCREMDLKLINEILKYKLSGLEKRYFYPIEINIYFLRSLNSLSYIDISFTVVLLTLTLK